MHMFVQLGELQLPTYGLMIALGVVSANLLAIPFGKKYKLDVNDFLVLEAYAFLGAFIGAKLLFLFVSWEMIDWSRFFEADYFYLVMKGGFVFYGGLIGGVCTVLIGGKIHKIDVWDYIQKLLPFVPWIHCFGRIGCYLAGCCYGRPYSGIFAVTYPEEALPPSDISLFPVQLVEAACLMLLFFVLIKVKENYRLEAYLLIYGVLRFILEYFRYDEDRGSFLFFSTSQWVSIILICVALFRVLKRKKAIKNFHKQ